MALEAHPGFCVYNPETLLKLRAATGKALGVNFDPSHLWWQQVDIAAAIAELGEAIFHFHAKDVGTESDPSRGEWRTRYEELHADAGAVMDISQRWLGAQ